VNAADIIDLLTELYEVYDTIDDAKTALDGAERAKDGKNPFPAPKEVEAEFKKLGEAEKELLAIASKGLGKPDQKKVTMDEVANAKTRAGAGKKFKENLATADAFVAAGRRLVDALKKTEADAKARSTAAREISVGMRKLVEAPLPDIGTVGKVEYFTLFQLFERAAGALGRVATHAGKAKGRVEKDLADVEEGTENLRANLKTAGVKL
jgi:hypothetical protein